MGFRYRMKTMGLISLSMGIGILIGLVAHWIGFLIAVCLISVGFWHLLY